MWGSCGGVYREHGPGLRRPEGKRYYGRLSDYVSYHVLREMRLELLRHDRGRYRRPDPDVPPEPLSRSAVGKTEIYRISSVGAGYIRPET